jgi:serine/threonine-protein kinase
VAELKTGTAIAGYRIESVLGHGSMGTVYSALEVSLERRVALKILTPELSRDERFRERFLRESKLAASLEHPHIVPIHAAGEADGVLYLAMRYVEGRDLAGLLDSLGRVDPERALAILDQVAAALDAAHARGLVHRDVKPANILISRHGGRADHAYLCDFGLAKHASTVSSLTGSRAIVGTVDYLAPEQVEGRPVDGRADVYALGCVLYECLTGAPPYERGNELASLLAHVNDPPPSLSERRAELPEALDQVIVTALSKDRDLRYPTCAELVEAAGAALHGEAPSVPQVIRTAEAVRTFLIADVRGYTTYTREQGDEAAAELAGRFASIVESLAGSYAGTLQELRGDEALVVFDSARQALRFALALQTKVAEEELPRPVGAGVDAGEAVPVEGGFRGSALNRAARLCALARPGEVLASDAVRELAGPTEGVTYGFRRVERLKGFEKPVGVVEVHSAERAPSRDLRRRARRALLGNRPRLRFAAAALVVAGAAAGIVLATNGGAKKGPAATFKPDTIGLLDGRTLKPAGTVAQFGAPVAMWSTEGQLWALNSFGSLVRIDPRTGEANGAHISVPYDVGWVAAGAGSLWVTDFDSSAVNRYDSTYGTLVKRIVLPTKGLADAHLTNGVAYGAGAIWVGYGNYPIRLARIDPATNKVTKTFDFPNSDGAPLVAYGAGGVWVATQDKGGIWRIDPSTNRIVWHAKLHDGYVEDLAVADGYAWLPVQGDGAVWQVDRFGRVLKSIATGSVPYALGAGNGFLYVANQRSDSLSRINTATGEVTTVAVGHSPATAAFAGGRVWVALNRTVADVTAGLDPQSVAHVAAVDDPYFVLDPSLFTPGNVQIQSAVGTRLLRHPDVAQPLGATLLPEVADLPAISNGGRTYTFRIRPGYRFSPPSGAPVTAEVMRYSIERALSPTITDGNAYAFAITNDIAGLKAYRDGKSAHISGLRVEGDRLSITLTAPDADFPERIAETEFSAVPLGTPVRAHGLDQPVPSAGPYYIAAVDPIVLKQNPNYHGPRPHRLEAIVLGTLAGLSAPAQVAANKSDYTWQSTPPPPPGLFQGGSTDRRFGADSAAAKAGAQRYFNPVGSGIRSLAFNAESGIFRDPRLRRAVSYALDRPALARATGDVPWADLLPPGIPGALPSAIYPVGEPDLARARALAGSAHRRAILFTGTPEACPYCAPLNSTIVANLAEIGIEVVVKPLDDRYGEATKPGAQWDLLLVGWLADYPDPVDFVNSLVDRARALPQGGYQPGWPRYADGRYLKMMRAATRLVEPARAAAYRRLETEMFRSSPPHVVFAAISGPAQLFSSRIGCQVFRPQDLSTVDLAALCIRGKS